MLSPRPSLLPFVPAVLLCLVAVVQVYLTRTDFLNPWKGGGFGMFSTSVGVTSRVIRIWISGPEGVLEIQPADQETRPGARTTLRAVAFPSERNMRDVARSIATTKGARESKISRVRITIWHPEHDVETLAPHLELLRDRVFEVGDSEGAP